MRQNFANRHAGDLKAMGWTDLDAALKLAHKTFAEDPSSPADTKSAIVLLTDGRPETETANPRSDVTRHEAYMEEIVATYGGFRDFPYTGGVCNAVPGGPAPLYVVPMVKDAELRAKYIGKYQSYWDRMTRQGGTVPSKAPDNLTQLRNEFLDILADLLCRPATVEERITLGETPLPPKQFMVTGSYVQIMFQILKDNPGISVEIYRPNPDGTAVDLNDPAQKNAARLVADGDKVRQVRSYLDEQWGISLSQPWSGLWTVVLSGKGTVDFRFVRTSDQYNFNWLRPERFDRAYPTCKPLGVAVEVLTAQGKQPITEQVKQMALQVTNPTGEPEVVDMGRVDQVFKGRYDHFDQPGDYRLQVDATLQLEGGEASSSEVRFLSGDPGLPWVEPVLPVEGEAYPNTELLPLQAVLWQGCTHDASAQLGPSVQVEILRDGQAVGTFPLRLAPELGEAVLTGEIPAGTLSAQDAGYEAVFRVSYPVTLENGAAETATDESRVAFRMRAGAVRPPTPTPTTIPPLPTTVPTLAPTAVPAPGPEPESGFPPWLPLGLVGVVAALAVIGGLLWFRKRPSLDGMTLEGGPTGPIPLRGRAVTLEDGAGSLLATLRPRVTGSRGAPNVSFKVAELGPGLDAVRFGGQSYGVGESFELEGGDSIALAGQTYSLRNPYAPDLQDGYSGLSSTPAPEARPVTPAPAARSITPPPASTNPRPSSGLSPTEPREPRVSGSTEPRSFNDDYDDYNKA